jgi:alkaline phosphatase D
MTGMVTHDSVLLWSRADRPTTLHVWLRAALGGVVSHAAVDVLAEHDFVGKLRFYGLKPATEYQYAVRFGGDEEVPRHDPASGSFRTAPVPSAAQPVRFAWGGTLAGQNVCRDAQEGLPIFQVLNRSRWDFFVAAGDMIHADQACEPIGKFGNQQIRLGVGPATGKPDFWAHWKYAREDQAFRDFLAATPYFPVWDDHEVVDGFGPLHDTRQNKPYKPGKHLLPIGLEAFIDYNPVSVGGETPLRLYRNVRWGRHVELFLLDTRQYRDANAAEDSLERPKTMLGREQATWLRAKLKASDATWKLIVTGVPIASRVGGGSDGAADGWAKGDLRGGFEHELRELLDFIKTEKIVNAVWLSAGLQAAQAVHLQLERKDSAPVVREFTAGPLQGGLASRISIDSAVRAERLFSFAPEDAARVGTFAQAKHWLNIGVVEISEDGRLTVQFINADGQTVWKSEVMAPQRDG